MGTVGQNSDEESRTSGSGGGHSVHGMLGRLLAAVQNGVEIARFGGLAEREASPYAVVDEVCVLKTRTSRST